MLKIHSQSILFWPAFLLNILAPFLHWSDMFCMSRVRNQRRKKTEWRNERNDTGKVAGCCSCRMSKAWGHNKEMAIKRNDQGDHILYITLLLRRTLCWLSGSTRKCTQNYIPSPICLGFVPIASPNYMVLRPWFVEVLCPFHVRCKWCLGYAAMRALGFTAITRKSYLVCIFPPHMPCMSR